MNDAVRSALDSHLIVRRGIGGAERDALFLSSRRTRLGREMVHKMVKDTLLKAGLDRDKYSAHKLRHTAATLMLQNGVDVRTLQEVLGHEHLNTTQIYTHVDNAELRTAALANPLGSYKVKNNSRRADAGKGSK
jgi:site-specific recombinase XerD